MPVYTIGGKNVVGVGYFKSYTAIWFFQGALLQDAGSYLINAQEGKTKNLRQWRLNSVADLNKDLISAYLLESIEKQKAGIEIKPQKNPLFIPTELQSLFSSDTLLRDSFDELGFSQKREFAEYISGAKREHTKSRRIAKIIPMVLKGIGLNDKYR